MLLNATKTAPFHFVFFPSHAHRVFSSCAHLPPPWLPVWEEHCISCLARQLALEGRSLTWQAIASLWQGKAVVPPCSCSVVVGTPWTCMVVAVKTGELQLHLAAGLHCRNCWNCKVSWVPVSEAKCEFLADTGNRWVKTEASLRTTLPSLDMKG